MTRLCICVAVICGLAAHAAAQSRLDGTSFQASTFNLPDSVGVVRLVDTPDSQCRSEAASPVGDDIAPEGCLVSDSGLPPVAMTFNAGPQTVGGLTVIPTVAPFEGVDANDPIVATNNATGTSEELATWSTSGDLIEFSLRTTDNSFPAGNEDDFFGFAATGIQYPNTAADAEVGFFRDEELDTHNNFYIWFENEDGPIATGYDIFLPVGLGVGRHPTDDAREVVYIFYSEGEIDENTDTLAGGSLDLYSHGSDLNADPAIGNLLFLADNLGLVGVDFTGFGLGVLVQPPDLASLIGDFDGDGALTGVDIDLLSAQVGQSDLSFDLTGDGAVTAADRTFWVETAADTFFGDADLNGSVEFADFLALSAAFGGAGGWNAGDFDGSGDIQFPDFLLLSANFSRSRDDAAQPVPEPTAGSLLWIGLAASGLVRRRRGGTL